ncbi:MAG: 3-dehydroquinate synthase [Proteobacteria bacterium]|nr:3-dehydroquinate synthase [Pseudomonadota bacterium]
MRTVRVALRSRAYPVYIGSGILARVPALLKSHGFSGKVAVVSDRYVMSRSAAAVAGRLKAEGWDVAAKALPRGERAKSFKALRGVYDFLIRAGAERRTPLVAIGGGTVGDAAGFAAATYFRGMPLVHVPTTLLAQVDSAIGGKTAVNHPLGKNAIGAFHQPAFVAADVDALRTLSGREFLSGLAEVVKYGLVFDPAFADRLEGSWERVLERRPGELVEIVAASVSWKAKVVAEDERDAGGRREFLNFGHTLGHALESATRFEHFTHGEGVAWGMRTALELSAGRGWVSRGELALAYAMLDRLGAPPAPRGLRWDAVRAALRHDKKNKAGRNVFILLRGLGRPVKAADVSPQELASAAGRAGLSIGGMR